jgi:hypothetical protein
MIPASQRAQIQLALGRTVLKLSEEICFDLSTYKKCDTAKWRALIETLWHEHQDVMETPLGALFTNAVLGRFDNANDASERRPKPGGSGFPGRKF